MRRAVCYAIEDNVCVSSTTCFFVGGGRDVIVRNNMCLHLDNRVVCVGRVGVSAAL